MNLKCIILGLLMQCIVGSVAMAGVGHTGTNGGNTAEIEFTGLWKILPGIFAPCLTPANRCHFSLNDRAQIQEVLVRRGQNAEITFADGNPGLRIQSDQLYDAAGDPRPREELLAVGLSVLLSCERQLSTLDMKRIAAAALSFSYFKELKLSGGGSSFISLRQQVLTDEMGTSVRDLSQVLSQKLRLQPGVGFELSGVSARISGGYKEISGVVDVTSQRRYEFQFLISLTNPESVELVIF